MTRRLVIRDMRAAQPTLPDPPRHRSGWRLPPGMVGGIVLVAFFAAWVVAMVLGTGCSGAQRHTATQQELCISAADAWSQGQIAARCETARFEDCPAHAAILTEWEQRARRCR